MAFDPRDFIERIEATAPDEDFMIRKVEDLASSSERIAKKFGDAAAAAQARELARKDAWSTKLGLTPGSVSDIAVNGAASAYSGLSGLVGGGVAGLGGGFEKDANDFAIEQNEREAYNRYVNGKATPADLALLESPAYKFENAQIFGQKPTSKLDRIVKAQQAGKQADDLMKSFDRSELVDPTSRNEANAMLTEQFKLAQKAWESGDYGDVIKEGAAGFGKLIVEHPRAVFEYVSENAPQLLAGTVTGGMPLLGLLNAGRASALYAEGQRNYSDKKSGELPSKDASNKALLNATATAVLDQVGDTVGAGYAKALRTLGKKAAEDTTRATLKEALLGTAKETAKSTIVEGGTEGAQAATESLSKMEDISAEDIYKNTVIGGAVGGAIGGTSTSVVETAKLAAQSAKDRAERSNNQTTKEVQQARNAAIESGDVTPLLDPKSTSYSPADAVVALHQQSLKEGITEDAKHEKIVQANSIVADLEAKVNEAAQAYLNTDKDLLQKQLVEQKKRLAATQDPNEKTDYAETIAAIEARLADPEAGFGSKEAKQLKQRFEVIGKQAKQAREYLNRFNEDTGLNEVNATQAIDRIKESINSTEPVDVSKDVQTVLSLSMVSPKQVSVSQARALVDNQNVPLTKQQRDYLKAFADVREHMESVSATHREAMLGDVMTGLEEHQERVGSALMSNNPAQIQQAMKNLQSFVSTRTSKDAAAQEAMNLSAQRGGRKVQILRNPAGEWSVNHGELVERKKNDDSIFEVLANNPNSTKIVDEITSEARVGESLMKAMKAAVALREPQATKTPTTQEKTPVARPDKPVKDVAKTTPAASAQKPSSTQDTATVPTPTATEPALSPSSQKVSSLDAAETAKEEQAATSKDAPGASLPVQPVEEVKTEATAVEQRTQEDTKDVPSAHDNNKVQTPTSEEQSTTEEPEATSDVEDDLQSKSTLTVFNKETKEYESLKDVYADIGNRVNTFLTQSKTKALGKYQDFLTKLKNGDISINTILNNKNLNEKQENLLRDFLGRALIWNNLIKGYFVKPKETSHSQINLIQDFINEDGSVDENVLTALSYSTYDWLANTATASELRTLKELADMNGISESEFTITDFLYNRIGDTNILKDTLINNLGRSAVVALGLKAKKDSPTDFLPKTQAALGAMAYIFLLKSGAINEVRVSGEELKANMGGFKGTAYARTFIKLNKTDKAEMFNKMGSLYLNSQSTLREFMGDNSTATQTSWEPIPFTQGNAKRAKQTIPKQSRDEIERAQSIPHKVNKGMWDVLNILGDQNSLKIAGAITLEDDMKNIHITSRKGIEAKNKNLAKELSNLRNFVSNAERYGKGLDQEFFIPQEVWKNLRAGMASNDINPQRSKIHRYTIERKDWTSTIDLNNKSEVEHFLIAVYAAMGGKTDQQSNDVTLSQTMKNWRDNKGGKEIADLSLALYEAAHTNGQALTPEQIKRITEIAASEEKMQSLQAMLAFGSYLHARKTGASSFTATMLVGVDGKTNGVVLSFLALGAAQSKAALMSVLNRGGFYGPESAQKTYGAWYAEGNKDLYQQVAKTFLSTIPPNILTKISYFTGDLFDGTDVQKAGRNLVKEPTTAFAFGSSIASAYESVRREILNAIPDKITEVNDMYRAGDPEANAARIKLISNINSLFDNANLRLAPNSKIEDLMEWEPTPQQFNSIAESLDNDLKDNFTLAMQDVFGVFLDRRNTFNAQMNLSSELYNAIYKQKKNAIIDAKIASGEIKTYKEGNVDYSLYGLTNAEEAQIRNEIRGLIPEIHSPYSALSGNNKEKLYIPKQSTEITRGNTTNTQVNWNNNGKVSSMQVFAEENMEVGPGVGGLPRAIHASDSAGMHGAIVGTDILNVHDEGANGPAKVTETASKLNRSITEVMTKYSPLDEARGLMERSINYLYDAVKNKRIDRSNLDTLINVAIKALPFEYREGATLDMAFQFMLNNFVSGERTRLEALASLESVDQYTWEGGEFEVTQELRDYAQSKLNEMAQISDVLSQEQQEMIEFIAQAHADNLMPVTLTNTVDTSVEEVMESFDNGAFASLKDMGIAKGAQHFLMESAISELGGDTYESVKQKLDEGKTPEQALEGLTPFNTQALLGKMLEMSKDIPNKNMSVWGTIGTPTANKISHNGNLDEFLRANPVMDGRTMVDYLKTVYGNGQSRNATGRSWEIVLAQLDKVLGNVTIRYITPNTSPRSTANKLNPGEAAKYFLNKDANGNLTEEILVLSTEFESSLVRNATLVHELVHAALARLIEQKNHKPEVRTLINELNALMEHIKTVSPETVKNYPAAFENLHEFIAYGLTNSIFQLSLKDIDIDTSVKGAPKVSTGRKLIKAIEVFIDKLAGIFFDGKTDVLRRNALGVVLADSIALMNVAKEANQNNNVSVLSLAMQSNAGQIDNMNLEEIFRALDKGNTSQAFQNKLATLINRLNVELHLPLKDLKDRLARGAATNATDAFALAKADGVMPFTTKASAHFGMSEQEELAIQHVELVMRDALDAKESTATLARNQLAGMFQEAKNKLKPSDFALPGQYDFIFGLHKENGDRSEHLARFMAMALGHEQFNNLLNYESQDIKTNKKPKTLLERLESLYNKAISWLTGMRTGAKEGTPANERLMAIAGHLSDFEAKRKERIKAVTVLEKVHEKTDEATQKIAKETKKAISKFANVSLIQNSRWATVRATGDMLDMVANERTEQFIKNLFAVRDTNFKTRYGVFAGLMREYAGGDVIGNVLHRFAKKNEGDRKNIMVATTKHVMDGFKDAGSYLTKQGKTALSYVALRSGLHNLISSFTQQEVEGMLADEKLVDKAISDVSAKLTGHVNQYIALANSLGYYRATDRAKGLVLTNAHAIAKLVGTEWTNEVTAQQVEANEQHIAELVTLFALKYSKKEHLKAVNEIVRTEAARTDGGNGFISTLKMAQFLEQDALERNFDGNKMLMAHGYTPEITNPHTTWKVAGELEGKDLEAQGYSKGEAVFKDQADPDKEVKHMYVLRGVGSLPWVSGAISLSSLGAKGTSLKGDMDILSASTMLADGMAQRQAALKAMLVDPMKSVDELASTVVPTLNEAGQVVDLRYVMQAKTKDELLQRNNDFADILGATAGSVFDKESSVDQDRKVVDALFEIYDNEYKTNPQSFMSIGPNVKNPEYRDLWRMLPEATKQYVRDMGKTSIPVKMGMLDVIFGYRKASLGAILVDVAENSSRLERLGYTDARQMAKDNLPPMQKLFATAVDIVYLTIANSKGLKGEEADNWAKRSGADFMRAGQAWTEIVKEAKDVIVVKTAVVLMGNMLSNWTLLKIKGVSFMDIAKDMVIAHKAALAYKSNEEELMQLKLSLDTGIISDPTEIHKREQRIIELEDLMDRNPVKTLIDAGLMPTIVEDVDADSDLYSYKSLLQQKVDAATGWVNPKVAKVAKTALLSKGTVGYDFLFKATQLSDFTARYVLYKHLVERKNNPKSHVDAIEEVSEAFVNYDIPMQRNLQWLDDNGIFMFSKYAYRIQRVLFQTAKENPLNMLMMILADKLLNLGPVVTESGIFNRIGHNPLESGALELLQNLDQIWTVKETLSLLK